MTLDQQLHSWNGKSSHDLEAIYQHYNLKDGFIPAVIALLKQESLQKGASWLLKRFLESGQKFQISETTTILKLLPEQKHWETRLHLLQCLPYMAITNDTLTEAEAFLRNNLADNNKFVRAWSYNGFYELSLQYPEFKEEAEQFLEMALRDEAPSVKERIRNIRKAFPNNS